MRHLLNREPGRTQPVQEVKGRIGSFPIPSRSEPAPTVSPRKHQAEYRDLSAGAEGNSERAGLQSAEAVQGQELGGGARSPLTR